MSSDSSTLDSLSSIAVCTTSLVVYSRHAICVYCIKQRQSQLQGAFGQSMLGLLNAEQQVKCCGNILSKREGRDYVWDSFAGSAHSSTINSILNALTLVNKQLLMRILVAIFWEYIEFHFLDIALQFIKCQKQVLFEYPVFTITLTLLLTHTSHSWMQQVHTSCLGIVKNHPGNSEITNR